MGRIPVGETELGYWVKSNSKYNKGSAHFVPTAISWEFIQKVDTGLVLGKTFKKEYPYRSCNIKYRYKDCPKWCIPYN
jgi:hypothetical protein